MKISLDKKILMGFIASAAVLLIVAIVSYNNSQKVIDSTKWVAHTNRVLYELENVLATNVDAETGMRGYVITGRQEYLEPYNYAKKQLLGHLKEVRELTVDNPEEQANTDTLDQLATESMRFLDECIMVRQRAGIDSAVNLVATGKSKAIMDETRRIIARAEGIEQGLLAQRTATSQNDASTFNTVFAILLGIIVIVLISVYLVINTNLRALRRAEKEAADRNWNLTGSGELIKSTQGNREIKELAQIIINQLTVYIGAQIGAFYLVDENNDKELLLTAGYAIDDKKRQEEKIELGEGLVGQAVAENRKILFNNVPQGYFNINSGLGSTTPKNILVTPFTFEGRVIGAIELGSVNEFAELEQNFLDFVTSNVSIAIMAARARHKAKDLLEETQRQSEELQSQQEELKQANLELQSQQEELKQANEELQQKTEMLERSEEELRTQQEELQQTNEELEEKAGLLEEQKQKLEDAKQDIETKARQLEITSKYKSEFLANMSHELRTPLNSILILAQLLSENKSKKLGEKEVEFSKNIYNSGTDLLNLINEILDLSKIESGKMELDVADVSCTEITESIKAMFTEMAKSRSVDFVIKRDDKAGYITTDKQRLEQVLRNLLSNAFKFTQKGGQVTLAVDKVKAPASFTKMKHGSEEEVLRFSVSDTGIGIPKEKQELIFEAFQQADGSTKRKYGGTGLGLSISRELTNALGGVIQLESAEGKGSTFTLYLPLKFDSSRIVSSGKTIEIKETEDYKPVARITVPEKDIPSDEIPDDDRNSLKESDRVILVVEDDMIYANMLLDFVRERNYKGIVARQGNTGLSYARHYKPDAILLDIKLPVMDGIEVLKQLKHDPELRHIPVQILSGYDKRKEGLELGAFDFLRKPISVGDMQRAFDKIENFIQKKLKKLLVIEDSREQSNAIRELIGNGDVKSYPAYTGNEALGLLEKDLFDCIVLDLGLPDMSGFDLLEKIKISEKWNKIPVIVYTGRELKKDESMKLSRLASAVILKTADSKERLLDETVLFLHKIESTLPKEKQNIIRKLHKAEEVLHNKKILVVDDDMRNIYSLTNALEEEGLHCLIAENGRAALEILRKHKDIDLVLMDVMMPEMDGYEATGEIRKIEQFEKIPIIALTAKAMKGDKEKCLAAGMSDYIAKPVNIEQLLSLMRVWLYK